VFRQFSAPPNHVGSSCLLIGPRRVAAPISSQISQLVIINRLRGRTVIGKSSILSESRRPEFNSGQCRFYVYRWYCSTGMVQAASESVTEMKCLTKKSCLMVNQIIPHRQLHTISSTRRNNGMTNFKHRFM
jgi:hypothetical protein